MLSAPKSSPRSKRPRRVARRSGATRTDPASERRQRGSRRSGVAAGTCCGVDHPPLARSNLPSGLTGPIAAAYVARVGGLSRPTPVSGPAMVSMRGRQPSRRGRPGHKPEPPSERYPPSTRRRSSGGRDPKSNRYSQLVLLISRNALNRRPRINVRVRRFEALQHGIDPGGRSGADHVRGGPDGGLMSSIV